MSILLKCPLKSLQTTVFSRALSSTAALSTKEWRAERGLPANRNAEGILTDGPDFTYQDGRPTPLLHKQMKRLKRQREYATKMVELCSELDFAKERFKKLEEAKEQERQQIISNRLKPKGDALTQRKRK
ncbi:unnamed protein product [Arctia plantaginis]|uniref:Large ribosomal subunit protein mL52 n=1 Tax=Arctia plantaginis TaxID=874455 RepID=A0A8S0YPC1_ARCPL|nr:unnamed protein product [Arctia plantaginis]